MKKLFACILCFAIFLICGCNAGGSGKQDTPETKTNIVYTANRPIYELKDLQNMKRLYNLEAYWYESDDYDILSEFLELYLKNIRKDDAFYYLLNPRDEDIGGVSEDSENHETVWFPYYIDCSFKYCVSSEIAYVNEYLTLDVTELGWKYDYGIDDPDGTVRWNIAFNIIFAPVSEIGSSDEIAFEFGNNLSNDYGINSKTYINIYVGEYCIATCYYREQVGVDLYVEWFQKYFEKNLFKGN